MSYQMKGSPMQRNFGINAESPVKQVSLVKLAVKYGKKAYKAIKGSSKSTGKSTSKTTKPNLKLINTQTGSGKIPTTKMKVETYQDISNPGKLHQIKYTDQGVKGGPWKPFVGEGEKITKVLKPK